MARVTTVEGLNELIRDINRLERMPQSQITKGVRRGANVILAEARARAPVKTGKMRRKLTLKPERSSRKGKKVMQITFQKVEKFPESVKIAKDGTRYYYPTSQNYGFKTRNGGRVEGKHFLEGAMQAKSGQAARVIVHEIGMEVERSLAEGRIR